MAHIQGERSRRIVDDALELLNRLSHRAAVGKDPETGDGAGILVQLPHHLFEREAPKLGFELPPRHQYGVAMVFLPPEPEARAACEALLQQVVEEEGQRVLGWRDVPVAPEHLGWLAREVAPVIRQLFVARRRVMVELLYLGGRTLPHALMMMIPEAWEGHPLMDDERRAFYEYSSALMEPWDGPAAIAFTDGQLIGATLDRNGLRPARYLVTEDDRVILASEAGVIDVPASQIRRKGRLTPGRMLLVDTAAGRILEDEEVKRDITSRWPYRRWLEHNVFTFEDLPSRAAPTRLSGDELWRLQRAFGYSDEDVRLLLVPMAETGKEPVGSMGTDTPLAVLSDQAPSLFHYFHQLFAQVTNPPIDPIREALVRSALLSAGLPAGQPHPRLQRRRLARPVEGGLPRAEQHQHLPRVHRPALSGTV